MTAPKFKPMLAFTVEDTSTLKYPLYASVKLDGIRCMVLDGVVYSRSMKPIRSKAVQELFGKPEYNDLDGEILYGDWNADNVFNLTTQAVMSTELKEGFTKDKLKMAVFDDVSDLRNDYIDRLTSTQYRTEDFNNPQIVSVDQHWIGDEDALLSFEQRCLDDGYEGAMVRSIDGPYKQGRSTAKEGYIGKIKRFSDAEAIVIGFEEKMHNTNEAKTNELGRTERSSSKEGLVGADTLGALVCEKDGMVFNIGSGYDDAIRKEIWENKDKYLGKLVTYKHFEVGVKDLPRFPIFLRFREEE